MILDDPKTGLVLKAVMPGGRSSRSQKYEDLLFMWEQNFACLDVPVKLIRETEEIEALDCFKEKNVFGTKVALVHASLFLMENDNIIAKCGRINPDSLKKMWLKALDFQVKAVKDSFSDGICPKN